MNRRQMVMLPGLAALATSRGFSQTPQATGDPSTAPATLSHKVIAHYSRLKSFYKVPKSVAKQTKYINFFTTLLSLSPSQQTELAGLFATASAAQAKVKASMKSARMRLSKAVTNNDGAGINRTTVAMGTLSAQRHTIGAGANAAFYQMLTPNQQATLNAWFPGWQAGMTTPPVSAPGRPRTAQ